MRLAMGLSDKGDQSAGDLDPRQGATAEIIDLASRTAYPAVTQRKGKSDALGMASGVAIVAVLGLATLWGMNASRMEGDEPVAAAVTPATGPVAAVQPLQPPADAAGPAGATAPVPLADPAPSPVLANPPQVGIAPMTNPYNNPTVVFDASSLPSLAVPGPAAGAPAASGNSASDFASAVSGRIASHASSGGIGATCVRMASSASSRTTAFVR